MVTSALLMLWVVIALLQFVYDMDEGIGHYSQREAFRKHPVLYIVVQFAYALGWPLYVLKWLKEEWDDLGARKESHDE